MLPKELSFMPPQPTAKEADLLTKKLTNQERIFCSAYDGDGVYACRVAGYEGGPKALGNIAAALLAREDIAKVIEFRAEVAMLEDRCILSKKERMLFYSSLIKNIDPYKFEDKDQYGNVTDVSVPLKDRIKAAELLSKAHGDFVDRLDINHNHTITDLVMQSYDVKDDKATLEAEWRAVNEAKARVKLAAENASTDESEAPVDDSFGGLL